MRVTVDGYAWIHVAEMQAPQYEWLRNQLTLVQSVSKEYRSRTEPAIVPCYVEDKVAGLIGLAREFFFEKVTRNHDVVYCVSDGEPWPDRSAPEPFSDGALPLWAANRAEDQKELTFFDVKEGKPVSLRSEQKQALEMTLAHLRARPAAGGIVQAPTGWGKTMFTFALARELRLKTAVLVHRKFLLNQWKKRLANFLPDAKVGVIAGDKWDTDGCHIVLVMIETVASWAKKGKVPEELHGMFGLVVTDEVHRAAAPTWSSAVPQFHAAKRLGISARPKRSDRLEKCFFYHIGPKIFTGEEFQLVPKVRRVWTKFKIHHPYMNQGFMSLEMMLKSMTKSVTYNQDVVDQILAALGVGRKLLVYSHTVDHLRRLKEQVDSQWKGAPIKTDFFIGGMTEGELDEAELANVIFATYQMAKDSLDIPSLDTVVLATPVRNPEQPGGRCLRPCEGKKDPIIVDFRADEVPICKEYAESRDRTYERLYPQPVAVKAG